MDLVFNMTKQNELKNYLWLIKTELIVFIKVQKLTNANDIRLLLR